MELNCAKCDGKLQSVTVGKFRVDRCGSCNGIWFDEGELERMLGTPGTAKVDLGACARTADMNRQTGARCPRCKTGMKTLRHPRRTEVEVDTCPVCWGTWLDGGEFKSLDPVGLGTFFKELLVKR